MGSYFIIINNISLVGWNTHGLLCGTGFCAGRAFERDIGYMPWQ
jgi:hypothetical protein